MESNTREQAGFTKMIEEQTAKISSNAFLCAAGGTLLFALGYYIAGKKYRALLLSQLASPLLAIGLYKKLITEKTDKADNSQKAESEKSMKQDVFQTQE